MLKYYIFLINFLFGFKRQNRVRTGETHYLSNEYKVELKMYAEALPSFHASASLLLAHCFRHCNQFHAEYLIV